jgi:hypothetical protein
MAVIDRLGSKLYGLKDKVKTQLGLDSNRFVVIAPDGKRVTPNPECKQLNPRYVRDFQLVDLVTDRESDGQLPLVLEMRLPKTLSNHVGYPGHGCWVIQHKDWAEPANFVVVHSILEDFQAIFYLRIQKGPAAGAVPLASW